MRIVFMGTPHYAATILEELAFCHEVVGVYTRADAVRGRGAKPVPSPVKESALRLGVPVFSPASLRDADVQKELAALAPDAICVAAYGMILPKEVLDIPRYGCLNAHASLLPRWRGAAPIERAILSGDEETGVCIMLMGEELDTGPFNICRATHIGDKTAEELTDELANLAAQSMLSALIHVEANMPGWTAQRAEGMTYAEKVEKDEFLPHLEDTSLCFSRKVQASAAAHPCRCVIGDRGVSVLRARQVTADDPHVAQLHELQPGGVRFVAKRLFLGCGLGAIEVLEVKPDGKQAMDAKSFAAGVQGIKTGAITWRPWHAS